MSRTNSLFVLQLVESEEDIRDDTEHSEVNSPEVKNLVEQGIKKPGEGENK